MLEQHAVVDGNVALIVVLVNALFVCSLNIEESFRRSYVPFSEFCSDPLSVLSNNDLVVRVDGKYYSWLVAAPLIMSTVVYQQVLPRNIQDHLAKHNVPKKVSCTRRQLGMVWNTKYGTICTIIMNFALLIGLC